MRPSPSTPSSASSPGPFCVGFTASAEAGERSRTGGCVLACNHVSSFDPWPLGVPALAERQLRFMAKSELYWWPLTIVLNGAGAFPVRRGQRDGAGDRDRHAPRPRGHAVAMFPEGTRRTKGLVKRFEARPRSGAARIALEAGVPLVPAAVEGHRQADALRQAPHRVRRAGRDRRPARPRARREAAHEATERLMARSSSSRRRSERAARRRRRLVRAPRVPRPAEDGHAERRRRLHEHDAAALAGRASRRGARRLGLARDADVPAPGVRAVSVRPRLRGVAARAARAPAGGLRGARLPRRRRRRATRRTTSSPRRARMAGPCSSRRRTATHTSS